MDDRDQETFERFAKRFSAVEDVIPFSGNLARESVRSTRARAGVSIVGVVMVLAIGALAVSRAMPATVAASPAPAATGAATSPGPVSASLSPEPKALIADPDWLPAGWRLVRPHVWVIPGPVLFASNAPIADPCPTELLPGDACRKPLTALPDDGVLVTIVGSAGPTLTVNNGILSTTGPEAVCAALAGEVEMSVPIRGSVMTACIRGPHISESSDAFRLMVATALGRPTSSASPSLPPGLSRDDAIRLARRHVDSTWTLLDVEAGPFSVLDSDPGGTGPDSPVKPDDLVWAVTYRGEMTICPPPNGELSANPCWSPRPGLLIVYLDYESGKFLMSAGSAQG